MGHKYYFLLLSEEEKNIYSVIYDNLLNFKKYIYIENNVETNILIKIIKYILLDNPCLFWFSGKWRKSHVASRIIIAPIYSFNEAKANKLLSKINETIDYIKTKYKGNVFQYIRMVYDWILNNVYYSTTHDEYLYNSQTIVGAIIEKKAVCRGISKLFKLCMDVVGIKCILVDGFLNKNDRHTWNIIYLDSIPYHIDVTIGYDRFNYLFKSYKRIKRYPCFMISDLTLLKTHNIELDCIPVCDSDFEVENQIIQDNSIPHKFYEYGKISFYHKGTTCDLFKIDSNEKVYILKIINCNISFLKYQDALNELLINEKVKDNKNIVPLIDSHRDDDNEIVYMLFPMLDTLTIRRKKENVNIEEMVKSLVLDILNALIYCRDNNIMHRDIQPRNIYYNQKNEALLGDFGYSVFNNLPYDKKQLVGTIAFMAPEIYFQRKYSEQSEIYSLGIIMYSLINNNMLPFMEDSNLEYVSTIRFYEKQLPFPKMKNSPLWKIIDKMCKYDLNERFKTYEEVVEKLMNIKLS